MGGQAHASEDAVRQQASQQATPKTRWQRAIQHNDLATLQTMLARIEALGQSVDDPTVNGKTALMAAALHSDAELVKRLLAAGADPNAANHNGGTPLLYAVAGGSSTAVEHLLAAGALIDQRSRNGWSPMMMAVAKRRSGLIQKLLQTGANPNTRDVYGWTPLMRAAYEGYRDEAIALLEQDRTDLERINDHGQTALHLAVIGERPALVELLLAQQAERKPDFAGYTPLDIAQKLDNKAIIALLTEAPD